MKIPEVTPESISKINDAGITILDGLRPLATKMAVPVNELWDIMVQHNNFVGWMLVLGGVGSIATSLWMFSKSKKMIAEKFGGDVGTGSIMAVLAFCLLVASHYPLYFGLERVIVPKYTTAVDIINLVQEIKYENKN